MTTKIPVSVDGATLDAGVEEYAADGTRATGLRLAQAVANLNYYNTLDESTFVPAYDASGRYETTTNNAGGSALFDSSSPAVGGAGSLLIDTQYDEANILLDDIDQGTLGCIELFIRPAYTGTPAAARQIVRILRNAKTNVGGEITLDHFTNGNLRLTIRNDAGTAYSVNSAFSPTAGTWYHISINWDFTSGVKVAQLFVGGVSGGTVTVASTRTAVGYTSPFQLGDHDVLARRWDGAMQELAIYATRLRTTNFTAPSAQLVPYSTAAPTATLTEIDFGTAYGSWDISTIDIFENPDSETGSLAYQYSASNTSGVHTYNGTWLTLAQLQAETDPTGRYLSIKVRFTSTGLQRCALKDGEISASQGAVPAPTFAGATTATDNTDGSVAVVWAAATFDAATVAADRGYEIHVHTATMVDADLDADTYYLARVPSDQTSLDVFTLSDGITSLAASTTYYFAVRAFQRLGSSRAEDQNAVNQSAAPTSGVTAPTAAINGHFTSITNTTFTGVLDAFPGSNIDRWRLAYRIKNDTAANTWTYSTANTTVTANQTVAITGLTASNNYEVAFQGGNGTSTWGDFGELSLIFTSNASNTWDGTQITQQIMDLIDDNLTSSLSLTRVTQYGTLADYAQDRDISGLLPMCLVELQTASYNWARFPKGFDIIYLVRILYVKEFAWTSAVVQDRVDSLGKLVGLFASNRQLGLGGGSTTEGQIASVLITEATTRPEENDLMPHDRVFVVGLTLEITARAQA